MTEARIFKFSIPLNPVPASRPRVARWGVYYPKTYKTWMEAAEAFTVDIGGCLETSLLVTAVHVVARPKTTLRAYPRGDVDNFAKATLDAVTKWGTIWSDDDQVLVLTTSKRFARAGESPATHVEVYEL